MLNDAYDGMVLLKIYRECFKWSFIPVSNSWSDISIRSKERTVLKTVSFSGGNYILPKQIMSKSIWKDE